ncbi:hypothetical protein ES705_43845 [subsurface metagenome]
MWRDPIVQEVRIAGEELAKRANFNLQTFFKVLRENERERNSKVVSREEIELSSKS